MDASKRRHGVTAEHTRTSSGRSLSSVSRMRQSAPRLSRRTLLRAAVGATVGLVGTALGIDMQAPRVRIPTMTSLRSQNVVLLWNDVALQAIRDTHPGPPMVARALAVIHTCMYDAWAAYHPVASPTRPNGVPKATNDRGIGKEQAISYAAYRALLDLFPSSAQLFEQQMAQLGYDPMVATTDWSTPAGIGNVCAQAVLDFRHGDGSNQANGYADTTGYPAAYGDYPAAPLPVNTPDAINDPNSWQPLRVADGHGGFAVQTYIGPHWGLVKPFALTSGEHLRSMFGPAHTVDTTYAEQAQEILALSAGLTDEHKVIAEYWKDGPHSEQPPGHWCLFGQYVSRRDDHSVDDDIQMFFALANALFDAGIAAWDAKRYYHSVRPVTAVRYLYAGQRVWAWAGPCLSTQFIAAENWHPYQPITVVTPPFPEFISGHSTFSAAGAEVLRQFTGSDVFGASWRIPARSSTVEPCTPLTDITLRWATFSDATNQAGISRRYGGIHFEQGDLEGRAIGRVVGGLAWERAQTYIKGGVP